MSSAGVGIRSAPSRTLDLFNPRLAAAVALPIAFGVGALIARKPTLGLALVVALAYATVVILDLPVALILYIPLTFLQTVKFPGIGPAAIGIVILAAWLGASRTGLVGARDLFDRQRALPMLIGLLLLWNAASIVWAPDRAVAASTLGDWARAILLFILIATTIRTRRDLRLLMAAFVLGSVLAILAGVVTGGLKTGQNYEGRLTGAAGDPNYLAAGIVPASVLAVALIATAQRWIVRLTLILALVILVLGFAATESRDGLLAAFGAACCAVFLFRRRRLAVLGAIGGVALVMGLSFAADPAAFTRITHLTSGGGNGRSDLWTVALRVWHDHVATGVGLDNFQSVEGHYVNRPGALTSVALIVDRPHVVHNVYLEALVDTGVIGLGLIVAMFFNMLRMVVRAFRRAADRGLTEVGILARAVLAAHVAVLIALFFLSDGPDLRLWVLFAMGPVLLRLSAAEAATTDRAAADVMARRRIVRRTPAHAP